jgi:hypothetical protein
MTAEANDSHWLTLPPATEPSTTIPAPVGDGVRLPVPWKLTCAKTSPPWTAHENDPIIIS